jgi:hypothetical protein
MAAMQPGAGRGDGLAVGVVLHVAAGEHAVDVGGRAGPGDEVAVLIEVEHTGEQVGVGAVADGHEQPGDVEVGGSPVLVLSHRDAFELGVAVDLGDLAVPQHLDLRVVRTPGPA